MDSQWALPHRLIPLDVGQPNERDFCRLFDMTADQSLTTKNLDHFGKIYRRIRSR
jgi:hypothetical protein